MKCDPELAKSAQKWTDQQAADGKMYHSKWTDQFTESISWKGWGWEGMDKMEGAIPGAVRSWYSEINNGYDYESGTGTGVIGHFQAVVWKDETKLGCGLNLKEGDGSYVTAHYAPPSHTSMNKEELAPAQVKPRQQPGLYTYSFSGKDFQSMECVLVCTLVFPCFLLYSLVLACILLYSPVFSFSIYKNRRALISRE